MRLLLSLSLVTFVISDELLFDKNDPNLEKRRIWEGEVFNHAITIDKSASPNTVALMIEGNSLRDELTVKVDDLKDIEKLRVYDHYDTIVAGLSDRTLEVISKQEEPGVMYVVENGVCKKRTYNSNSRKRENEEQITGDPCGQISKEIRELDLENEEVTKQQSTNPRRRRRRMLYFRPKSKELVKINPKFGGTFYSGYALDKSVSPHRFGMYMEGNGIEDEFHVTIQNERETSSFKMLNQYDRVVFRLQTQDISIISKTNEDGVVVIDKGKCKRLIYDDEKPYLQPMVEIVSPEKCTEKILEVETLLPLPPDIWFFSADTQNLLKKVSLSGGTFKYGTVWDKRNSQSETFKLGIYIKGEYLEEELHLDVKSDEEANSVEVMNENDKIVVKLPSLQFGAIAKASSRGKLVVVEKGVCKRRMYKPRAIQYKSEIELEYEDCVAVMKDIGMTPDSKESSVGENI